MKILILIMSFITTSYASTHLVMIGGGKKPPEALARFSQLAGGTSARVLVISWASSATDILPTYQTELAPYGVTQIEVAPTRPLSASDKQVFLRQLQTASGVFFTGGDQNRVMDVLRDQNLKTALQNKFQSGTVFAGTSAGTAIMSATMLTGRSDLTVIDSRQVEVSEGLGLLPAHVVVDQHFVVRQRLNRLLGVVQGNTHLLGVGIDEDTALEVTDGTARVLGPTQVLFIEAQDSKNFKLKVLSAGDQHQL